MSEYCTECGAEIEKGSEFCINCGAKLEGKTVAPRESVQAEYIPPHQDVQPYEYLPSPRKSNAKIIVAIAVTIIIVGVALFFVLQLQGSNNFVGTWHILDTPDKLIFKSDGTGTWIEQKSYYIGVEEGFETQIVSHQMYWSDLDGKITINWGFRTDKYTYEFFNGNGPEGTEVLLYDLSGKCAMGLEKVS